ncbi:EF-hand calcium-binding domain-containing protein 8 [Erinaceus europaeus]|uniref:WD repeat-containing protein on Y chromosome n=1 Tax=Erinaceus europaeus TaxID=9365 RepID=A0ABM3X6F9_ERIEU|nr:EF-hand calcium-binding domain-containing protein 8 [Erinaceus europaeus]
MSQSIIAENLRASLQLNKFTSLNIFQKTKEMFLSQLSSLSSSRHMHDVQHEIQLFTEIQLAKMEKMFEDNIDSHGVLDMDTFVKSVKKIMNDVPSELLEALFLKVDTDCKGFITWQKYVDYMMREFRGKEKMRRSQYRLYFHLPMKIIPQNHGCEIVKVLYFIQRYKKIGHFLTITKNGILQVWTESFLLVNSYRLSQQIHSQQMWVVDMVCLHSMNLIAISSTDQKIEFFDVSNYRCVRAFTFTDLDNCVLVMDYWSDYHKGAFCFGDTKGNVIVFTSEDVNHGLFNPRILPKSSIWDHSHWITVSVRKLLNEKSTTVYRSYRLKALHSNWCEQVKFIPQMNLVASCSTVKESSLVLTVLPSKNIENPKFSVLNIRKGILCFDYCPDKNFLVTGGYDSFIRLWNPFFSKKPVWLMKGHQSSVTHILVNSKNSHILVSVSKDKNIRVWDMLDYVCLQSFCGKVFALGNCPIISAYFHKEDTFICSTYSIGILQGYSRGLQGPGKVREKTRTHSTPLCAILYSKIFRQVVSGCLSGVVSVWEIMTGRRLMEFPVTHDLFMELTAMSLDESERCLLTGLRDGTVKMWNYNIGECVLTFPNPDRLEISGIIHMNKVFYVTGWSKRITCFMFHKTKPVLLCHHWQTFHTEDILSMAKYQNQFLGTSSYNGDIFFWNINSIRPIFKLNASESALPLKPKRVHVQESKACLSQSPKLSRPHGEKWAHKYFLDPRSLSVSPGANANLRRNLMSAPPVMRHPSNKEPDVPVVPLKKPSSAGCSKQSRTPHDHRSVPKHAKIEEEPQQKVLEFKEPESNEELQEVLQSNTSVEKIIFLQTRPRLPNTAALLSSCIDGYIYAWSIYGNGGLLGKFPVDFTDSEDVVVGAMTTDENDWILLTGDCKGDIKVWDIKDYCTSTDKLSSQSSWGRVIFGKNKFQFLIPKQVQINVPRYISLKKEEVMDGQTISLVPPKLLAVWNGHSDSISDILYVNSLQVVLSAGLDRDVKAWKISGDAIGTFGLSIWKRLQATQMISDRDIIKKLKTIDMANIAQKLTPSEMQEEQDFAAALKYQQQEEAVLMALWRGKGDAEAEAWDNLRKITPTSPWPEERSLEAIEDSWREWESTGKQTSKVVGAAYKPKEQCRAGGLLLTHVQYGWMKYHISPQIYQSLHFNELAPTQLPEFLEEGLDQQDSLSHVIAHKMWKKMDPDGDFAVPTVPAAASPPSSLISPLASEVLDSSKSPSPRPQSSLSLLQSQPIPTAHNTPSLLSPGSMNVLQRPMTSPILKQSPSLKDISLS